VLVRSMLPKPDARSDSIGWTRVRMSRSSAPVASGTCGCRARLGRASAIGSSYSLRRLAMASTGSRRARTISSNSFHQARHAASSASASPPRASSRRCAAMSPGSSLPAGPATSAPGVSASASFTASVRCHTLGTNTVPALA
jgi:hypothetical protein